ncbi:MAG: OmpA family protein [Flammeovirgaceae bacterium]
MIVLWKSMPRKLLSFILICLLLVLITALAQAQSKRKVVREAPKVSSVTSEDGRYFCINYSVKKYKNGEISYINSTKVYHIISRKYISKINFYLPTHPEYFKFSPDAKKLFTKSKNNFYLIDIKTRRPQQKFEKTTAMGFLDGSKYVTIASSDSITVVNTQTLKEAKSFKFPQRYPHIHTLIQSPDGKRLIAKGSKKCYLWDIKTRKLIHTFNAKDISYSTDNQRIYAISYRSRLCYLDIYDAKSFKVLRKSNSNEYKHFSTYSFTDASSFSPDRKYIAFCAKRYGETKGIGVFEIESGKLLLDIDSIALGNAFAQLEQPYQWFNDADLFVLAAKEKTGKSFSIAAKYHEYQFRHKYKERRISPNGKYIVSFSNHVSSNLITVGLNDQYHSPIFVDGIKFISFSPNSKYLFVEKKDRSHGFILTKDILPNQTPKVYPFSTIPFIPGTEDVIAKDAAAPDGYQHTYITQHKHISELTDTTELSLHLKTVEVNGDTVGIQAHLIDQHGVYYYGASAESFRDYWCNIQVKSNTNPYPTAELAYSITEVNEQDTIPLAIAFIMDHSGSMGDERALVVQEAVEKLISEKRPQDTMAIMKYDSKIGIESELASDKGVLLNRLKKDGLGNFGGGTALIDAAFEGITLLQDAENYENKVIVIFTDGKENSSVLTKNELILEALAQGIKIYTISFGSETDVDYLKELSEATEGGYYQIYETLHFLKIFDDVYERMRNYYSIQFKADTIGEHEAVIKLCLPNRQDSFVVSFENDTLIYEEKIEELPEDQFSDFDDAPEEGAVKRLQVNFHFATTNLTDSSHIEIEKAVAYMRKYPKVFVELRGHTDDIGSEHDNLKLSRHRAHKIKHLLTKSGISGHRIKAIGLGEEHPIATNKTEAGRAMNRRTEFVIVSNEVN